VICADEIHSDLLLGDTVHTPIAALSPELEQQTITLIAPTKTYNLAGLACSVAIVPNNELRQKMEHRARFSGYHVDTLAFTAALAGYRDGEDWLHALRAYLTENRDFAIRYLRENLPILKTTIPQSTYLLWIDAAALPLDQYENAHDFFLKEAKVAVNPGTFFGAGYESYVRLNLATPRSLLQEGLERMKKAVDALPNA
jgi:cystathionine beta-lyase